MSTLLKEKPKAYEKEADPELKNLPYYGSYPEVVDAKTKLEELQETKKQLIKQVGNLTWQHETEHKNALTLEENFLAGSCKESEFTAADEKAKKTLQELKRTQGLLRVNENELQEAAKLHEKAIEDAWRIVHGLFSELLLKEYLGTVEDLERIIQRGERVVKIWNAAEPQNIKLPHLYTALPIRGDDKWRELQKIREVKELLKSVWGRE